MQHQNPMCFQMDFDFDTALPHFVTHFATSPVRNNGPLTRKMPFRTAPTPLYWSLSRIMRMPQELVTTLVTKWHELARIGTNTRSHQQLVTTLVTKWHEFAVGTHDTANRYLTPDYCGTFPTNLCIFTTKHQTFKLRICMHKGSPGWGSLWCKLLVLS